MKHIHFPSKYTLSFVVFILLNVFNSCHKQDNNTIDPAAKPSYTGDKIQVFRIANSATDLNTIVLDSVSKDVLFISGKKTNANTISTLTNISRVSTIGNVLSFDFTESTVWPVTTTFSSTKGSGSVTITAIYKDNLTIDIDILNMVSGTKIQKKGFKISQVSMDKLIAIETIYKTSFKPARVESVICVLVSFAGTITENFACVYSAIALPEVIETPWGPEFTAQTGALCTEALTGPIYREECETYEDIDYKDLPSDCLKAVVSKFTEGRGECVNKIAQILQQLLSNQLAPKKNSEKKTDSPTGHGSGDPHLRTIDGLFYDFQGYGEFIAAKSATNDFQIQVRQEQVPGFNNKGVVTFNTGISVKVGADIVCVLVNPLRLYVNSKLTSLTFQNLSLTDGAVTRVDNELTIHSAPGDLVRVITYPYYLDYALTPGSSRKANLTGLLGNFDDNPLNDLRIRDGSNISNTDFTTLYPAFMNSWRISQTESLFYYDSGKNTDSYTNNNFPQPIAPIDEAILNKARNVCTTAGITDQPALNNCIMDVALTGNSQLAESALRSAEINSTLSEFSVNDFGNAGLDLNGDATIADTKLYLTKAGSGQDGSCFQDNLVDITTGFEVNFSFSMTNPGGITDADGKVGADGLAFLLHSNSRAFNKQLFYSGGVGIGYGGVPRSLAIEFDSYKNSPADKRLWINTQGVNPNSVNDAQSLIQPQVNTFPSFWDQNIHKVKVTYVRKSASVYTISIFFDDSSTASMIADTGDLAALIGAATGKVYIGFTAATAAGWENHIIHSWSYKQL